MGCAQPPLNPKPMRGYSWTRGPCSCAYKQAVEGHDMQHVPSPAAKPKSYVLLVRGRRRLHKGLSLAE